jgi:hypothetical protein
MADPVTQPTRKESDDFFDHVKKFFLGGADKDPSKSEIVNKGGPGGQLREKSIMDAVDNAVNGAKDDPI